MCIVFLCHVEKIENRFSTFVECFLIGRREISEALFGNAEKQIDSYINMAGM